MLPCAARYDQGVWPSGLGQVAGSGGLPCGVHCVAPEVPAPVALRAVRHLAAAALAFLGAMRRGVRAPPVLTLRAARLAHRHTRRDGCRGLHQVVYMSDVRWGTPGSCWPCDATRPRRPVTRSTLAKSRTTPARRALPFRAPCLGGAGALPRRPRRRWRLAPCAALTRALLAGERPPPTSRTSHRQRRSPRRTAGRRTWRCSREVAEQFIPHLPDLSTTELELISREGMGDLHLPGRYRGTPQEA